MLKTLEKIIERILWDSRFIVFVAVVASIVSAIVLVFMGAYDIWLVVKEIPHALSDADFYEDFHHDAIVHIISAIDAFLITTVLLIFGIGLYELFISKIDYIESDEKSSKILEIHSLDQLKEKLAKVIIMVLIVTFFRHAMELEYATALELLYLAVGVLLISLSAYFMQKGHHTEDGKGRHD